MKKSGRVREIAAEAMERKRADQRTTGWARADIAVAGARRQHRGKEQRNGAVRQHAIELRRRSIVERTQHERFEVPAAERIIEVADRRRKRSFFLRGSKHQRCARYHTDARSRGIRNRVSNALRNASPLPQLLHFEQRALGEEVLSNARRVGELISWRTPLCTTSASRASESAKLGKRLQTAQPPRTPPRCRQGSHGHL